MNIHTPRLYIRKLKPEDLKDFHTYRSNPEITRYQGFDVMNLEEAALFIEEQQGLDFSKGGEWVQFGIALKSTGKIVGDCAVRLDLNNLRIAETSLTISHLEQQKGFGKESLHGILGFLFNKKNIHRVVEIIDTENTASVNLVRSMGFRQEGHFLENRFFKGKWRSEYQFAMLKREWLTLNP